MDSLCSVQCQGLVICWDQTVEAQISASKCQLLQKRSWEKWIIYLGQGTTKTDQKEGQCLHNDRAHLKDTMAGRAGQMG